MEPANGQQNGDQSGEQNEQQEEKHDRETVAGAQTTDATTPPVRDNAAAPADQAEPDSHSGLGIASSIIAASALLLFVISIICLLATDLGVLATVIDEQMSDDELTRIILDEAPLLIAGILILLFTSFVTFIGAVLGLAGLFQPNRKRLFAILGTLVNGVSVLFFLFIGLAAFLSL